MSDKNDVLTDVMNDCGQWPCACHIAMLQQQQQQ